jgi:hypothetical protein
MDTPTRREVRSDALRRELRPLLNSVERDHVHVTVKRYDDDTAVIVPVDWYQRAVAALGAIDARWNDAIDWLLNSRHCGDPDIQAAFWGIAEGNCTRKNVEEWVAIGKGLEY